MRRSSKTILALSIILLILLTCVIGLRLLSDRHKIPAPDDGTTADDGTQDSTRDSAQPYGWLDLNDGKHYFDPADGTMVTGWLELDGKRYYLDKNGILVTGWLEQDDGTYYLTEDGTMAVGWLEWDGNRYFFDNGGLMATGWVDNGGNRYFLDDNGTLVTGWLTLGRQQYYMDDSGALVTGWMEYGEDRYYFREDGTMAVGEVVIDGCSRYFTSSGKYVVLVNCWNPVPEDYATDLVEYQGYQIDASCADALDLLLTDCNAAGFEYYLNSVYRSLDDQQQIWDSRYTGYISAGYSHEEAELLVKQSVAVPGTSEHHLGLAADVGGSEEMYAWMREHSWEYGFIVRYPDGKTDYTGIIYEPWHIRYVGVELAQELYTLDLCMEEYMALLTSEHS